MKVQKEHNNKFASIQYYQKYYIRIAHYLLNNNKPIYLGNENNKICRFCGKSESNGAKFEKIAHALPESVGNKCLFSYYECDACNQGFGKRLESEYANYMNLYHTISGIKGKKKIPQFENENSKMKWIKQQFGIIENNENIHVSINQETHSLTYQNTALTHIPMAVFKCFVKMALTIMPESELEYYKDTIAWINNSKHNNIFGSKKLLCRYAMVPGFNMVNPSCSLYRHNGSKSLGIHPYMLFNLTYGIFSYLIEVPTINDIHQSIEKIRFPPVPYIISTEGMFDLSSNEKVSNYIQNISFHFEKIESLDKDSEKLKTFINLK